MGIDQHLIPDSSVGCGKDKFSPLSLSLFPLEAAIIHVEHLKLRTRTLSTAQGWL